MKVLLTGFEPFGGHALNASWEGVQVAARQFPELLVDCLPVDYVPAQEQLWNTLEAERPEILLMCGMSGYPHPKLECVANKPEALAHVDGLPRRHGKWPWDATTRRMHARQIPFSLSRDAGRYVCESTYWAALTFRMRHRFPRLVAFLHVPQLSAEWSAERIGDVMLEVLASLDDA